jgi:hypothetical protein
MFCAADFRSNEMNERHVACAAFCVNSSVLSAVWSLILGIDVRSLIF